MLELEVDTGKSEMARISTVAARAQKDLDIARAETKSLTNVVSGLQERLDALEARGSVGSDHPPLESGSSDDGWGPGPCASFALTMSVRIFGHLVQFSTFAARRAPCSNLRARRTLGPMDHI